MKLFQFKDKLLSYFMNKILLCLSQAFNLIKFNFPAEKLNKKLF